MRALIQRVSKASVTVNKNIVSSIDAGLLILLGIKNDDSSKDVQYLVKKIINMRIFASETSDNFEKSLIESKKELLVVSQFTLYGELKKGRRPSFIESAKSDYAFEIINDGPVTLMLDSRL